MDYARHYDVLIARAVSRSLVGYAERHHIIPRCLGGADTAGNRVNLTPEEHYVTHQLLARMYPNHRGLLWAAVVMTTKTHGRNNKMYGWLRRKFGAMSAATWTGRKHTPEARAKMRAAKLGKVRAPHSIETKLKMSASHTGMAKPWAKRDITHGTHGGYNRGCRCDACRNFFSVYLKDWRARRKMAGTLPKGW